jgi:hypothetical protein
MGSVYECESYFVSLYHTRQSVHLIQCQGGRQRESGKEELMNRPFQCGAITIGWSGDEGPYHLLLTPIEIRQHSYNVSPVDRASGRFKEEERDN